MLAMVERTDAGLRRREAGQWLAAARKNAGFTQKDLEVTAGLGEGTLSNYERGLSQVPDDAAERIADALGRGLIETRRSLNLWVPADATDPERPVIDALAALRRDQQLRPDLRDHIIRQYEILRETSQGKATDAADILDLPHAARKRTPRKPRA